MQTSDQWRRVAGFAAAVVVAAGVVGATGGVAHRGAHPARVAADGSRGGGGFSDPGNPAWGVILIGPVPTPP